MAGSRPPHRFLISTDQVHESTITIDSPQELRHIQTVLRLTVGDQVRCFDGTGAEYLGTIEQQTKRALVVRIDRRIQPTGGELTLWLAQGLLKAERFEWVVQKATELGVSRLTPLVTAHTVIRLTEDQGRAKAARWRRIAQEAAKQCGRPTVPHIDEPQPFKTLMASLQPGGLVLIPTLSMTTIPLADALKTVGRVADVTLLIGPEGDFTRDEVSDAQAHGARPVSLGPLTLRSETAAVAGLAMLRYAFGH